MSRKGNLFGGSVWRARFGAESALAPRRRVRTAFLVALANVIALVVLSRAALDKQYWDDYERITAVNDAAWRESAEGQAWTGLNMREAIDSGFVVVEAGGPSLGLGLSLNGGSRPPAQASGVAGWTSYGSSTWGPSAPTPTVSCVAQAGLTYQPNGTLTDIVPGGAYGAGMACTGASATAVTSATTVGTYAVGTNPVGVAFDGTNIWVTNANSGTVTKLLASAGSLNGEVLKTCEGPTFSAVDRCLHQVP